MKLVAAAFAIVALLAVPAGAETAQCRDAKGKFVKCGAAGATPTTPAAVLAEKPAEITKDKNGKCHFAAGTKKGQFTACPKK